MLLAGDIGGTKTVIAVFSAAGGPHAPLATRTYPSAQYGRLEAIIREFLAEFPHPVTYGCFGVAGPVVARQAKITNLPWIMDEQGLAETFGWQRVILLNDLEAVAYAIPTLRPEDLATLNDKPALEQGNIAVIAPGTGLGEAFMTWDDGAYRAHASEGGHASFAPINEREIELLRFLHMRKGHGHVSYERVCSGGLGVPNLHAFLHEMNLAETPDWLAAELENAADVTPILLQAGLKHAERPAPIARDVLSMFINILGNEAGNLAIKVLATGGVYIGGGIPPRILDALREGPLIDAFTHKGRFRPLLEGLPVHVILNTRTALTGAAARGLKMLPAS